MPDGGTSIALASRPFNDASLDMGRPPQTSRAYSRTGRAALAAGTLGTVGDDVAREDVKRYVEVSDAHRDNPYVMPSDHEPREWYDEAERLRQSRLRRWQAIR
jgi:hypothetical protein